MQQEQRRWAMQMTIFTKVDLLDEQKKTYWLLSCAIE
jgi:hypothetical protein